MTAPPLDRSVTVLGQPAQIAHMLRSCGTVANNEPDETFADDAVQEAAGDLVKLLTVRVEDGTRKRILDSASACAHPDCRYLVALIDGVYTHIFPDGKIFERTIEIPLPGRNDDGFVEWVAHDAAPAVEARQ